MVRSETVDDGVFDGKLRLVAGVDVRQLPIGPTEAFVLSRIDGQGTLEDLSIASGLALEEVAGIVRRLAALGAVQVESPRVSVIVGPLPTMRSGEHAIPRAVQQQEDVDLTLEQQHVLLALDHRLGAIDHYELLGVERTADAKSIRAAYYEQVRVFHPDRHFGKPLGRFQAPLLRVFGKCTEAYDVLRRAESRLEYDRYLLARERTLALDHYFQEAQREAAPGSSSIPPASGPRESRSPSSTSLRVSSAPPSDPEARRRALARKLGHSSVPPRPSSSGIPLSSAPALAAEELKRRYEQRLSQARDEQKNHYLNLAKEAEGRSDLLAAANALRVAASLAPDDLELAGDLGELERRAAAGLWEAYVERAKYAAVEGRPAEAAEAFERAALGHPSPALFERAAFFVLESGGDLKRAAKLAKEAVALAPGSAKCRLTLAQVFAAADLRESALAELERARALEPDQPLIKEWIARVKRGVG